MRIISLLLFFSFGFSLTMQDTIESALKNNKELEAQRYAVKSAIYSLKADKNLYLPKVFLDASYNILSDKQKLNIPFFGAIESSKQNYKDFRAGLSFVLYDGGAREGKVDVSSSEVRVQERLYKEKEEDVVLQVINAYLDVLTSKELIEVIQKQKEAVESQYERARAFYKEGLVAITDVLQAQVRLAEVLRDLRQAEGNYKVALSNLSRLTGIPEEEIRELSSPSPPEERLPSLEELYSLALQNREIIKAFSERVYQAGRLKDIERSNFLPKVFVQAQYNYSDQNPVISPKGVYVFSAGLSLEFQSFEPYYRVLSRMEEEKRAKAELENLKDNIKLEVKRAYENLLTARDNLRVAEESLKSAEEFYKLSLEQYKNQIISSTDLLLAEASLTQARKNKVISYYDYLRAYYQLMRAVGGIR